MVKANGFATKSDVKNLQKQVGGLDKRLGRVEVKVGKVEDRFVWFRGEIKQDLELWKQDNFRLFEHRWQQFVDPVLKEVVAMREEQAAHYSLHERIDKTLIRHGKHFRGIEELLGKIAKKVGVRE